MTETGRKREEGRGRKSHRKGEKEKQIGRAERGRETEGGWKSYKRNQVKEREREGES